MATATSSRPGRYARAAAHRGQGLRRRKPPQPTGIKKVLSAAPSSKKGRASGLALAAAAAGMAFMSRDKLSRRRGNEAAAPPSTPVT
jgi:hypothetical protein